MKAVKTMDSLLVNQLDIIWRALHTLHTFLSVSPSGPENLKDSVIRQVKHTSTYNIPFVHIGAIF